jgi:hypothetical protein
MVMSERGQIKAHVLSFSGGISDAPWFYVFGEALMAGVATSFFRLAWLTEKDALSPWKQQGSCKVLYSVSAMCKCRVQKWKLKMVD